MNKPLLIIQNLSKTYKYDKFTFTAEVKNLVLMRGQALGIIGNSGCGKSTILEIIALLSEPTNVGKFLFNINEYNNDLKLYLNNKKVLVDIRRKYIGFIHQAGGLFPFLTARENIELPLLINNINRREIDSKVNELLHFLEIDHISNKIPEYLSYGERQRVAIARSLINNPSLILADEPTSALDPDSAEKSIKLLYRGALIYGAGLIIVSHDHKLLEKLDITLLRMEKENDDISNKHHFSLSSSKIYVNDNKENIKESKYVNHIHNYLENIVLSFFLACKDFFYEYALSICAILAFAAALTPILVLGGLRNGIVTTLSQRLLNNPATLAVNPYGSRRYTKNDIEELKNINNVSFVIPLTRTLASTVIIPRKNMDPFPADIVPTEYGDPLINRYTSNLEENSCIITEELARNISNVKVGDDLDFLVTRRISGVDESVKCSLKIQAIIPDSADWKTNIYILLPLALDIEKYRDGYAVNNMNWPGKPIEEDHLWTFASFRMYVNNLDAVVFIRDELKKRGIDAWTSAREVETIQGIKKALTLIMLLIGGVTIVGMIFSLASLVVSNIRRKARIFAYSRLLGLSKLQLISLPLIQLFLISFISSTSSLLFYYLVSNMLDIAAVDWLKQGETICSLSFSDIGLLYGFSLILSIVCGLSACHSVLSLKTTEVLRRDA